MFLKIIEKNIPLPKLYYLYYLFYYMIIANGMKVMLRKLNSYHTLKVFAAILYWTLADDTVVQRSFLTLTAELSELIRNWSKSWFTRKTRYHSRCTAPHCRLTFPTNIPFYSENQSLKSLKEIKQMKLLRLIRGQRCVLYVDCNIGDWWF